MFSITALLIGLLGLSMLEGDDVPTNLWLKSEDATRSSLAAHHISECPDSTSIEVMQLGNATCGFASVRPHKQASRVG